MSDGCNHGVTCLNCKQLVKQYNEKTEKIKDLQNKIELTENVIKAFQAVENAALEMAATQADNEVMPDDDPPMTISDVDPIELCRAGVRATKKNIAQAIRAMKKENK